MSDELLLVVQVVANEGGAMDIFQLPKMFLELGPYRIRRLRYSPSLPNEFARLSMPAAHTNLKHESRVVSTALPMHPRDAANEFTRACHAVPKCKQSKARLRTRHRTMYSRLPEPYQHTRLPGVELLGGSSNSRRIVWHAICWSAVAMSRYEGHPIQ